MFSRILVPLDTSAIAEQALPRAAAIAKALGAELLLVLVHEPVPAHGHRDAPWNALGVPMERAYLDGKARELESRFGIRVDTEHLTGSPSQTIIALADSRSTDLVVMTTHGHTGLRREWIGSVADTVMRSLDVPVLMLRPIDAGASASATAGTFHRIMIPLDGSHRAESVIDSAVALGGPNATYVLARVVTSVPVMIDFADAYAKLPVVVDPEATDLAAATAKLYIEEIAARLSADGARSIEQVIVISELPAPALLDIARTNDVDLIAIATHGRGPARLVLGSVTDKLLRGGSTPLLVRRSPGT
ncbi:MAG: UspA domain protein [Gemmatimonadetes bacterium]|nr:UspA domain protein [Gemmatimonadota bacterium]